MFVMNTIGLERILTGHIYTSLMLDIESFTLHTVHDRQGMILIDYNIYHRLRSAPV